VKKKKTIVINNPQLRKIRDNLRLLYMEAARAQWFRLSEEKEKILYDGDHKRRHPNDYSMEEREKLTVMAHKMTGNTEMVEKSICKCYRCVATDKNMTYNPVEKAWYCFQCYEEMKRWTMKKKTGISVRFP